MAKKKEMFLIQWGEKDGGIYYSIEKDDIAEKDSDVMGKIVLSENASSFLEAISLLNSVTDADCRELGDPIDELITKCIKLMSNRPK